ncbi:MAG: ROK family protein [Calditrichia bacterium]
MLGVEIGGTKLQVGIGPRKGRLLQVLRRKIDPENGAAGIRAQLIGLANELVEKHSGWSRIKRAGIGFGGPVLAATGVTVKSFQINGWESFPLCEWAQKEWNIPVGVQNDASTAAIAESVHGAGRHCSRLVYITIGSGIGGGYVVDRKIDEGQGTGGMEIGHTWVPHPTNGEIVELENLCSGWAIGRRAREAAAKEKTSLEDLAGSISEIDAKIVYLAAENGDSVALRIIHETCFMLGIALGNLLNVLHPERLIIGGGVSLMGNIFWNNLRAEIQKRVLPLFWPKIEIVRADLGEEVVVTGALCL